MPRSRNWTVTHNNYDPVNLPDIEDIKGARYWFYSKEVGGTCGTPHLQGAIGFNSLKSLDQVKCLTRTCMPGCHLEAMRGTVQESIVYCSKTVTEDNPLVTQGDIPISNKEKGVQQAERWKRARIASEEGRFEDVEEGIRFNNIRLMMFHRDLSLKKRRIAPTFKKPIWIHGPSGTGKSVYARTTYPLAYMKMCNKWWEGYEDQDTFIIEDFDKQHACLLHHIKIWFDHYDFLAEIKGSSRMIRPGMGAVTCNWHPREIWPDPRDHETIMRRFDVYHLPYKFEWTEEKQAPTFDDLIPDYNPFP